MDKSVQGIPRPPFFLNRSQAFLFLGLLAAVFIRLYFFIGLNFADDTWYVFLANQILEGNFHAGDIGGLRLMMIFPLALSFKFFGISNASAVLYPFLCSLGTIGIAYAIGKLLFDLRTAHLAIILMTVYPLNVIYATWIMPDVPVDFFLGLSVLLFLSAYKMRFSLAFKRKRLLLWLSGLFIGVAYLANVRSLVVFFALGPWAIVWLFKEKGNKVRLRRTFFSLVLIVAGFLAIIAAEGLYHWKKSGDIFLSYKKVAEYYTDKNGFLREGVNNSLNFYPQLMFNRDSRLHFLGLNRPLIYGLYFYLFLLSILGLIYFREHKAFIPLWWFVAIFAYLQFGSMSLKEYIPIHRLDRHLTVVTIPMVLCCAAFLSRMLPERLWPPRLFSRIKTIFVVSLILFFGCTSVFFTKRIANDMRAASYDMKAIYRFFKDRPSATIYGDPGVLSHLHFYFKFQNMERRRNLLTSSLIEPNSYVILNGTRGFIENPNLMKLLPKFGKDPESSWTLIKVIEGPKVGIYASYDPKIYYVAGSSADR